MADRIVLHVGTMKTGTSFVQSVLQAHPDELAAAGAEYLIGFAAQSMAAKGLLRLPADPDENLKKWRKLARTARRSDAATGIVSMEFLGFAGPAQAQRALAELEGLEVSVVVTVRDQARVIPAQWQTYVRNQGTVSWADYLTEIRARRGRGRPWRSFHRAQDVARVLDNWADAAEVTCVTVPPPGGPREELWDRFCEAAGIARVDVDVSSVRDNPSIGYGSCELLRLVNPMLEDVPTKPYRRAIKPLAREHLVPLRAHEDRPRLDRAAGRWAVQRNAELRELLAGRRVVGSLDDLAAPGEDWTDDVLPPDAQQVLTAARTAWLHAASLVGVTDEPPTDLDALVQGTAAMLSRGHGWATEVAS